MPAANALRSAITVAQLSKRFVRRVPNGGSGGRGGNGSKLAFSVSHRTIRLPRTLTSPAAAATERLDVSLRSKRDAEIAPTGGTTHDILVRAFKCHRLQHGRLPVPDPAVRTAVVPRPIPWFVRVEPTLGVELSIALRFQMAQLLFKLCDLDSGGVQSRLRNSRQITGDVHQLNFNLVHLTSPSHLTASGSKLIPLW
jgi:hypothetical protein